MATEMFKRFEGSLDLGDVEFRFEVSIHPISGTRRPKGGSVEVAVKEAALCVERAMFGMLALAEVSNDE